MSAEELDALLGDPHDDANPVGHAALLAADERREMPADGERLLDAYGMNAEFVPAGYGGRLTRADRLADVQRTLWRRDPSLGLGHGFSSLLASVNVWTAGTPEQRKQAAAILLSGGRIAAAFHELDHGNDFAHADCSAARTDDGWLLTGRKEIVTNLRRADAMVLFARTSRAAGSRSHSQFLVTRDELPADRIHDLPRFPSSGMRGVQLGGLRFTDCPVPADALLGRPGEGMEIALRSYQLTRSVFPAVIVGPLDSALRLAVGYALDRRLYGGAAADLPYVRAVLARAQADLLAVDAFSAVVLRALHLAPESMGVYAPAAKYLTSRIVLDAFEDLRSVLGAQSYLREGRYAMFQKLARDIAPATFAHVSRAACQVTLLPQLPRLARRSWPAGQAADPSLFDLGGPLPPLDLGHLVPGVPPGDGVLGALAGIAGDTPAGTPAGRFANRLRDELGRLGERCAALSPKDTTIGASPAAFALADRYTVLLAAVAVLGVWHTGGDRHPAALLPGVLDRLCQRLGGPPVLTEAEREEAEQHLFDTAVRRYRESRLFDLSARHVPG
ncbi:acyl-CoA dehydrogenase family protein [Kitasatospora sp. RG8]|uniref:acyl-CoA dehydrogenase family protein n=1 Tax=Kitasatospora sp. RG8 TaxID=2820815 RepID=UPI001AE027D9|nr:acyl-CoA dehydrogenase family protein [Kitasatospora sp. RG8]MBP0455620.1 acyl-CoA dehydrogenase family protein [Kitasatospora sp. RG8]